MGGFLKNALNKDLAVLGQREDSTAKSYPQLLEVIVHVTQIQEAHNDNHKQTEIQHTERKLGEICAANGADTDLRHILARHGFCTQKHKFHAEAPPVFASLHKDLMDLHQKEKDQQQKWSSLLGAGLVWF